MRSGHVRRRPIAIATLFLRKVVGSVFGDATDLIAAAVSVLAKRAIDGGFVISEAACVLSEWLVKGALVCGKKAWR